MKKLFALFLSTSCIYFSLCASEQTKYPLHLAAEQGNVKKIQELLDEGNIDINQKDQVEATPLHWAALKGHVAAAQLLIKSNAEVNASGPRNDTPLHAAVSRLHIPMIKVLINAKAFVDCLNDENETPLHIAAQKGCVEAAQLLISKKALINTQNNLGNTPLHLAADLGHREIAQVLLAAKAQYTIRNQNKETACQLAYKSCKRPTEMLIFNWPKIQRFFNSSCLTFVIGTHQRCGACTHVAMLPQASIQQILSYLHPVLHIYDWQTILNIIKKAQR